MVNAPALHQRAVSLWARAPAVATRALAMGAMLTDLIYPPHCMSCRAATQHSRGLCATCWATMRFIGPPLCDRLGVPFVQDLGPGLVSPDAVANPPVYDRARAVACFDDGPARSLIHQLKYADRPDVAKMIGPWMARAGRDLLAAADVVVPVPLHRRRLWARRYNQAALLALSVGRLGAKRVDLDSLVRVKPTRSQVGMSRTERAANIQGAFRVAPEAAGVRGSRVLLVDDVLTTGSTANAAARVLLRAGASAVDVLVFARVVTSS